ncbi:MAG: LPS export ABC transporter permease LptG [Gammaproteobacteria bacterium]|nr:LPS export ABC transporter permease LptG [Gammaproteobacteria bacterium]NNF60279.1 LPS export ABC transporter permease LptG [Gammaproteobacteria bacterium]NNM20387.1 LPS export ABC transporter permease LptG [Gammaproteobacteria bacterium]
MSTLDRYILGAVIRGTLMVLLVLLALNSFVSFISQVDNVGQGSYQTADAIAFVALNLPSMTYWMLPIATLLGALLGLGNLASHSELIVMRAAGVSPWRLARSVMLGGIAIVLLAVALGELIAPPAEQYAKRHRTMALHNQLSMAQGQSGWIRDGNVVINIEQLMEGDRAGGIYVFTFDEERRLQSVVQARSASFDEQGRWLLDDSRKTEFLDDRLQAEKKSRLAQQTALSPGLLGLSVVDPDSLASRGLYAYINYLRTNGLDADRYIMAFWSRIATVVSIVVMAMLALPFVFGPLRSTGTGQRMFMGILIGAGYFLINRLVANSGAVLGLDPALTAWLPTITLLGITLAALARVR